MELILYHHHQLVCWFTSIIISCSFSTFVYSSLFSLTLSPSFHSSDLASTIYNNKNNNDFRYAQLVMYHWFLVLRICSIQNLCYKTISSFVFRISKLLISIFGKLLITSRSIRRKEIFSELAPFPIPEIHR